MKIVIIEDEKLTAQDLELVLSEVNPAIEIISILSSVKQGKQYFQNQAEPDLIFSDIQLGDGLSFEIFEETPVKSPIIFCTAYDEYALQAFQQNGIDYVLKPFSAEAIRAALDKYERFSDLFSRPTDQLQELRKLLEQNKPATSSILVYHREKIIPIKISDIAVFYIENQLTHLITFDEKTYYLNTSLDQLEKKCGPEFFRANRQHLINRQAVREASHHLSRKFTVKLQVPLPTSITVSKEKLSEFLTWLEE
ncbi:MAG TPA: LytTR family DNA-binding domain-containing protein [Sphingobacteriaceae bacterium]|nr:LytTR family DNA-binding domain-containing protein [Sphingobacteriaceae bacterium]